MKRVSLRASQAFSASSRHARLTHRDVRSCLVLFEVNVIGLSCPVPRVSGKKVSLQLALL